TTRRIAPIKMNPGEMPTWWVPQLARELQSLFVANSRKSFCIVRNRARCPAHIERVTVKGLLTGAPPDFIAVNPVSGRNGRLRRELPVPQRPQPHWQLSYPPPTSHHCTASLLCQGDASVVRLRLTFMEGAASTFDPFQDISGAGGPDERIGALVVVIDVVSDRGDEFFD